jgi:predicted nucleic acid-binding protein
MSGKGVLVDTGPLVAIIRKRDQYHAACVAEAKLIQGPFYTCWPVVTEAAYLLSDGPSEVQRLLARVRTSWLRLLQLDADDMQGVADILDRYADQRFDFADAALMHLAERESIGAVFTTDRRHFSIYRTKSKKPLVIRPTTL